MLELELGLLLLQDPSGEMLSNAALSGSWLAHVGCLPLLTEPPGSALAPSLAQNSPESPNVHQH